MRFVDLTFLYPWLKIAHIFLAMVAVGFNLTYGILLRRAAREPEHMGHVLRTVKFLDDRFATPAYLLLLVPGLTMVFIGGWNITTFWIHASLALYVVLVLVGVFLNTPTLRRQIAVLETAGGESEEFRALTSRGAAIGLVLGVIVVVILSLMVLKPTL